MKSTAINDPRERLIFALDVGGPLDEALAWVDRLWDHVGLFKVGKESFVRYGTEGVRRIQDRGGKVFLDLKFHDIPHTVARAAEAACELGVAMFNLHASGGKAMMAEAASALRRYADGKGGTPPILLAVTVLTSLNDSDLQAVGFARGARETVLNLARLAQDAGVAGVVASAEEAGPIRDACGDDFLIVTPGIRTAGEVGGDDQKRIVTPCGAIRRGADFLVVGRPISRAANPASAADGIAAEIAQGLAVRQRS